MQTSELRVWARQERYFDYRREAERDQLARLTLAGRPAPVPFYRLMLAGLGRRLNEWGCRLEARYGIAECLEPRRVHMASR